MKRPNTVIGLDIGTTTTIGIAVAMPDRIVAVAKRPVTLSAPHAGWAEEDPLEWWRNSCEILRELTAGLDPADLAGICATGMLPAVVLLDSDGALLRPSIQQSDGRCSEEVEELRREVDADTFLGRTGNGINQQLVAPKLVHRVEPRYPPLAVQARAQAAIILEAHVDRNGHVKNVTILRGHPLFDDETLAAVKQWRYQPLLLNGVPTEFLLTVTLFFKIESVATPN